MRHRLTSENVRFVVVGDDFMPAAGMELILDRSAGNGRLGIIRTCSPWGGTSWSERRALLGPRLDGLKIDAFAMDVSDILVRASSASLWRQSWGTLEDDNTLAANFDPAAGLGDEILLPLSCTYDPPDFVRLADVIHRPEPGGAKITRRGLDSDIEAAIGAARQLAFQLRRELIIRIDGEADWRPIWGELRPRRSEPRRPSSYNLVAAGIGRPEIVR